MWQRKLSEGLAKNEKYDINRWNATFNNINKRNYTPQRCDNFCPYKDECEHGLNMVLQGKIPRGQVNIYEQPVLKSLKDAETKLFDIIEVIQAKGVVGKIDCIKAPTGIGKTELYLDAKDTTIALPTHKLKAEVYRRSLAIGNDVEVTPELPDLPIRHKNIIEHYYSIGAYDSATIYINNLAEEFPEVKEYLVQMERALKAEKTLFTTHQKLMYLPDNHNKTIIIDEDVFNTMFPIDSVAMADWKSLEGIKFIDNDSQETINNLLKFVGQGKMDIVYEMPNNSLKRNTKVYNKIVSNARINTNILGFLECTHFIKSFTKEKVEIINFISKRDLPLNKKIIIMSATLNEQMCKLAFGDRMVWHDIGDVDLIGKIIQYPQKSFSRWQVRKNDNLINMVQGIIGNMSTITFKALSDNFNTIATYGATAGLDEFGGRDIAVVGTPHVNPMMYLLFAHALGLKLESNETEMTYRKIKRNGFEYYFNTYDEEMLREIQLYLIESELLQAIGRARILRNDCTVIVFSNLPIHQSELKYLTKEEWDIAYLTGNNYRQD